VQNSAIRALVDQFVSDVTTTITGATRDRVMAAFGGEAPRAKRLGRELTPTRAKGEKRSGDEIEKIGGRVIAHAKRNPGQGIEAIGKALGIATRDLALPVKNAIRDGALTTKGHKRATKYFAR
jgi:hypothetical protein